MVVSSHKKLLLSGVVVALLTSGCGWIHWRSNEPARDRSSIDSAGADVTFANDQKKARAEAAASAAAGNDPPTDAGAATTTPMPTAGSDQNSGATSGSDAGGAQTSPMQEPSDSASSEQTANGDVAKVGQTTEKVTLQGDALFQFGKVDEKGMLPGGKQRLDELADKIMAMEKESIAGISIVGHADRLGSPAGNMAISEKRAATVMNYLVRRGVDAAILQSMGKGDADPVTDCPGGKANKALIACLSPNRRVEVVINSK